MSADLLDFMEWRIQTMSGQEFDRYIEGLIAPYLEAIKQEQERQRPPPFYLKTPYYIELEGYPCRADISSR